MNYNSLELNESKIQPLLNSYDINVSEMYIVVGFTEESIKDFMDKRLIG